MPHKNKIAIRWLIVVMLLTQLACQTVMEFLPISETPAPDEGSEATAEVTDTPTVIPPTPAPPGLACTGHFGYGVTCIHEAEWLTFTAEGGGLNSDQIQAITTCPDGRLVLANPQGIDIYDGESWRTISNNWGYGSVEGVACSAAGEIWVGHFGGVTRWAAGEWTTYDLHEFLTTDPDAGELVEDVVIDAQGVVWVVTSNSLARFSEGEWKLYEEGRGFKELYFLEKIAFDGNGRPWVAHSQGLLTFDGVFWEDQAFPSYVTPTSIAVDHRGQIWVGTLTDGLHVFDGQTWRSYQQQSSDLSSNRIAALAVDGQNRIWVGTDWGLNVFDGVRWETYWMSNAGVLSNQIDALGIEQGGPRLPKPAAKAPGVISGTLTSASGEILPQTPVELCVGYIYRDYAETSLCEEKPFMRSTETDAQGAFAFEDIPPGRYMLTAHPGDQWYLLLEENNFTTRWFTVQSEATTDLGAVALPPPEEE